MDITEEEQEEMRRRLRILEENFRDGKIRLAPHLVEGFEESYNKIQYKDGQIDLDTVDGRIRSMALAMSVISDRNTIKDQNPIREIQKLYFEFIEANFGMFYEVMCRRGLTPHDAGTAACQSDQSIKELCDVIPEFLENLNLVWENLHHPCLYHLQDMQVLKGVFSGDLSPSYQGNIASTCGIYLDTIILPDPFLRMSSLVDRWAPRDRAYYFMKHAMILLNYKDLALADVDPPIVVVVPDQQFFDDHTGKLVWRLGEKDGAMHASRVFGEAFNSFEEVVDFADGLKSIDDIVRAVCEPERLLFDTAHTGTLEDRIRRGVKESFGRVDFDLPIGRKIAMQCAMRMASANDSLLRAKHLHGVPLIDAPTSWKYFGWKIEYDDQRANGISSRDTRVSAALQEAASGEMTWLGNIPPEAIIELRKTGALEEIREVLRNGVSDLETMDAITFQESSAQVISNLRKAVNGYDAQIEKLRRKKWHFAGKDIGSWLTIGSIEVAAAAIGTPLYGLGAFAVNQLLDAPKLHELIPKFRELQREAKDCKSSPLGILFSHKNK